MLEQILPFGFTATARLLDPAEEAAHLSQSLLFPRLENSVQAAKLSFVAHDRLENGAHPHGAVAKDDGRGLAGGDQLGQAVFRCIDHQVDVLFQGTEAAFLPESFFIDPGSAGEERFPRGNREG